MRRVIGIDIHRTFGEAPPRVAPVARRIRRASDGGSEGTAQADPGSKS